MGISFEVVNSPKFEHNSLDSIDFDAVIIKFEMSNDVDVNNSQDWSTIFQTFINGGIKKVVIDMEELSYIDSSGIGNLIFVAKLIRGNKGDIAFFNVPDKIYELFALVHLQRFIRFYDSEKEAIEYLKSYV